MKPFFVYMLRCSDGSYYVGHTDDLEKRMAEHEEGSFGGYTSRRRPVELVWSAEVDSRDEALQREMQIKPWSRAKKEALIASDWKRLKQLARGSDQRSAGPSTPREPVGSRYARDERNELRARSKDERREGAAPLESCPDHPERRARAAGPKSRGERAERSRA